MSRNLVLAAATGGVLYGARRYYRNWGTTKEECQIRLPGDELVHQPAMRTTEGVTIDAPAGAVWPWLLQIGQDRGGLYSYQAFEKLVGLDYRNSEEIHPEWQTPAPGDLVRLAPRGWLGRTHGMALAVEQVIEDETRALVLRGTPPQFPWRTVMSFHVLPRLEDRCRLLVRTRTEPRRPGEALLVELAGPVMALLTRGMLLGIKERAERSQEGVNSTSGSAPKTNRRPDTLTGTIRT